MDDNAQMRRLIRSITSDVTAECYECGEGREALAAYERHRPEWIPIDIEMKDPDGINATRRIKGSYPEAQVVIVTDDAAAASSTKCPSRDTQKCNVSILYVPN